MYFYIESEISGGLGENSVIDTTVHPPIVSKLHYQFDGWSGDELLESFPCFIVTATLSKELEKERLSGFRLCSMEVSKSEQFHELYPGKILPHFYWLNITGAAGTDDFGIAADHRLVVSKRAIDTLRRRKLDEVDIEDY